MRIPIVEITVTGRVKCAPIEAGLDQVDLVTVEASEVHDQIDRPLAEAELIGAAGDHARRPPADRRRSVAPEDVIASAANEQVVAAGQLGVANSYWPPRPPKGCHRRPPPRVGRLLRSAQLSRFDRPLSPSPHSTSAPAPRWSLVSSVENGALRVSRARDRRRAKGAAVPARQAVVTPDELGATAKEDEGFPVADQRVGVLPSVQEVGAACQPRETTSICVALPSPQRASFPELPYNRSSPPDRRASPEYSAKTLPSPEMPSLPLPPLRLSSPPANIAEPCPAMGRP